MKLLLLSNSTTEGFNYLEHAINEIKQFTEGINSIAFVPYAGVTINYNQYSDKVQNFFNKLNIRINSIHNGNPISIIKNSDAIAVGGGNTFQLLKSLYDNNLINLIRDEVKKGKPYIGWSAGSNVACPTINTTNDMPIVEPQSFQALNLIDYQINPHYSDAHPSGHHGETREQRIQEYEILNQDTIVVGLREGSMILIEDNTHTLLGTKSARIFKYGIQTYELTTNNNIVF